MGVLPLSQSTEFNIPICHGPPFLLTRHLTTIFSQGRSVTFPFACLAAGVIVVII